MSGKPGILSRPWTQLTDEEKKAHRIYMDTVVYPAIDAKTPKAKRPDVKLADVTVPMPRPKPEVAVNE